MNWNQRLIRFFLLALSFVAVLYLYTRLQRNENQVVVIMRSSNEDCDEFRRAWKIDRVVRGELTRKEQRAFCCLINTGREYKSRDSVEWIKVEGGFTHENGQTSYADCIGVLVFRDKTITPITPAKNRKYTAAR